MLNHHCSYSADNQEQSITMSNPILIKQCTKKLGLLPKTPYVLGSDNPVTGSIRNSAPTRILDAYAICERANTNDSSGNKFNGHHYLYDAHNSFRTAIEAKSDTSPYYVSDVAADVTNRTLRSGKSSWFSEQSRSGSAMPEWSEQKNPLLNVDFRSKEKKDVKSKCYLLKL